MGNFDELFSLNVPHVLRAIFLQLEPPDLDCCRAVCRAWRHFIHRDLDLDPRLGGWLRERRARHAWMHRQPRPLAFAHKLDFEEAPSPNQVCVDPRRDEVVVLNPKYRDGRLTVFKDRCRQKELVKPWKEGISPDHMVMNDSHIVVWDEGKDALVFSRNSLKLLFNYPSGKSFQDDKKKKKEEEEEEEEEDEEVEEDEEEDDDYDDEEDRRVIITVKSLPNGDIYFFSMQFWASDETITVKKLDPSKGLVDHCALKADFEEVYDTFNCFSGGTPCYADISETHVAILLMNGFLGIYTHDGEKKRKTVYSETLDDNIEGILCLRRSFLVLNVRLEEENKQGLVLIDPNTGDRLKTISLCPLEVSHMPVITCDNRCLAATEQYLAVCVDNLVEVVKFNTALKQFETVLNFSGEHFKEVFVVNDRLLVLRGERKNRRKKTIGSSLCTFDLQPEDIMASRKNYQKKGEQTMLSLYSDSGFLSFNGENELTLHLFSEPQAHFQRLLAVKIGDEEDLALSIFRLLSPQDLRNCLTVCEAWKESITSSKSLQDKNVGNEMKPSSKRLLGKTVGNKRKRSK